MFLLELGYFPVDEDILLSALGNFLIQYGIRSTRNNHCAIVIQLYTVYGMYYGVHPYMITHVKVSSQSLANFRNK